MKNSTINQSIKDISIKAIKEIAEANPWGFTATIDGILSDSGWCIADLNTQNSFGDEGLEFVYDYAVKHNLAIGGWLNEENNLFYWDATHLLSADTKEAEAVRLGKEHKQISIYSIDQEREIML